MEFKQFISGGSVSSQIFGYMGVYLLLNFSETIALEEPRSFFPLLDLLVHPGTFVHPLITESDEGLYQKVLSTLEKHKYLQDSGALASFERALALHVASPKIEAFHRYYAEKMDVNSFEERHNAANCPAWVDWYGQRICTPDELLRALGYECSSWISWDGNRVCGVEEYVPLAGYKPIE